MISLSFCSLKVEGGGELELQLGGENNGDIDGELDMIIMMWLAINSSALEDYDHIMLAHATSKRIKYQQKLTPSC